MSSVKYKGNIVKIPSPIDRGVNIAKALEGKYPEKVYARYYHSERPDNQFTEMYLDLKMSGAIDGCDIVMLMEHDMVWPAGCLKPILNTIEKKNYGPLCTYQIEFWKSEKHFIPVRQRPGAIFHNVSDYSMPVTGKNGSCSGMRFIDQYIYNYGFCMQPINMFWKHLIGLSISTFIKDSQPDEDWYEKKWISWNYETNNKDLEISKKYRHVIPYAIHYVLPQEQIPFNPGTLHIERS